MKRMDTLGAYIGLSVLIGGLIQHGSEKTLCGKSCTTQPILLLLNKIDHESDAQSRDILAQALNKVKQ